MPPQLPDRELLNKAFTIQRHSGLMRLANNFNLDVKNGLATGYNLLHKFGAGVVAQTPIPIWDGGVDYTFPTTVETLRIKAGGDVADTAAGAGAREVTIQGLDTNFDEVEATLATNGVSASAATTQTFSRVFRAWVSSVGTYGGANTAAITIENVTANQELAIITAGKGQTLMAIWTVPRNRHFFLNHLYIHVDSAKSASAQLNQRQEADNWTTAPFAAVRVAETLGGLSGSNNLPIEEYIDFPEKTDIWLAGSVAQQTADIDIAFGGIVLDTSLL
jgi:hypothetical protein